MLDENTNAHFREDKEHFPCYHNVGGRRGRTLGHQQLHSGHQQFYTGQVINSLISGQIKIRSCERSVTRNRTVLYSVCNQTNYTHIRFYTIDIHRLSIVWSFVLFDIRPITPTSGLTPLTSKLCKTHNQALHTTQNKCSRDCKI